jgi:hypothetical protein
MLVRSVKRGSKSSRRRKRDMLDFKKEKKKKRKRKWLTGIDVEKKWAKGNIYAQGLARGKQGAGVLINIYGGNLV